MLKIGLTGGIGSGKSTIAKVVETLGYPVYVSDRRASALMNQNENIRKSLKQRFGEDIYLPGGTLDKKRLAAIIFNDKNAIADVNSIVHPVVTANFMEWCKRQRNTLLFFESAILYEAKLESLFDYVITVTTDVETRVKRVMKRDTITREKVLERIGNQMPDKEKIAKADFVVYNNEGDQVVKQILTIIDQLNHNAKNGE